jgi:hypothetical protein
LIIASYKNLPRQRAAQRLQEVMAAVGLDSMRQRFWLPLEAQLSAS